MKKEINKNKINKLLPLNTTNNVFEKKNFDLSVNDIKVIKTQINKLKSEITKLKEHKTERYNGAIEYKYQDKIAYKTDNIIELNKQLYYDKDKQCFNYDKYCKQNSADIVNKTYNGKENYFSTIAHTILKDIALEIEKIPNYDTLDSEQLMSKLDIPIIVRKYILHDVTFDIYSGDIKIECIHGNGNMCLNVTQVCKIVERMDKFVNKDYSKYGKNNSLNNKHALSDFIELTNRNVSLEFVYNDIKQIKDEYDNLYKEMLNAKKELDDYKLLTIEIYKQYYDNYNSIEYYKKLKHKHINEHNKEYVEKYKEIDNKYTIASNKIHELQTIYNILTNKYYSCISIVTDCDIYLKYDNKGRFECNLLINILNDFYNTKDIRVFESTVNILHKQQTK